MGTRHTTDTS